MKRRTFLHATAGALTVVAAGVRSGRALAEDTVDITLRSASLAGGLAFNGTTPGPLLRVVHGQRIRVRYVSDVDVPTSIHWHGMLLPNAMDGVAGVTQPPVRRSETFVYEFAPGPPGTRWYHDHAFRFAGARGLFGAFIVEDPADEPGDRDYVLVFHDVPNWRSFDAALRGVSGAPMSEPMGAPHGMDLPPKMGDEVAYAAYRINGASYPHSAKYEVRVGERVRLRIVNASPTQTRYLALAGHELLVTHADGNRLEQPVTVDVLRVAAGERYDAMVVFSRAGAFLLQGISSDPREMQQQAVVFHTDSLKDATPQPVPAMLDGLRVATYETLGGVVAEAVTQSEPAREFVLGGGGWNNPRWTIDDRVWPRTPKLVVRKGERVTVRFRNTGDMEHPMHLHGHVFELTHVNDVKLARPLRKDGALVAPNGTATWRFVANAEPGRWMLHCHNDVHMDGGMMTEVLYRT
jgi:FtsP/CotA-like multicopper oxidase with cupredoxin domain